MAEGWGGVWGCPANPPLCMGDTEALEVLPAFGVWLPGSLKMSVQLDLWDPLQHPHTPEEAEKTDTTQWRAIN